MSLFTNEKWQITVRIPHFGSAGTVEFLRFLAVSAPKEDVRGGALRGTIPTHRTVMFEFAQEVSLTAFVRSIEKIFKSDYLSYNCVKLVRFNSSWEHLEAMVKGHDVFHQMSDDHRVWQNGQSELLAIKNLANKLAIIDKERVREIVKGIYKLIP